MARHRPFNSTQSPTQRRRCTLVYSLLAVVTALLCMVITPHTSPVSATTVPGRTASLSTSDAPGTLVLEQQGRSFYEAGRFTDAIPLLQQAVQQLAAMGDGVGEAIALSNLALTYQQLGAWTDASDAIERALGRLQQDAASPDRLAVLAQALDVKGSLQLAQGKTEAALDDWQQATALHQQAGNLNGVVRGTINQAQALQNLGLYRRAIALLRELISRLETEPDSVDKAISLRSLGDALFIAGSSTEAQEILNRSLAITEQLDAPEAIATTYLSLGNMARAQALIQNSINNATAARQFQTDALSAYQQAAATSTDPQVQTQAQLNRLRLLIELGDWEDAESLYPQILQQIDRLPPGRSAVYARVNLAQSVMRLGDRSQELGVRNQSSEVRLSADLLARALQQAEALRDERAQSFVLGSLGTLYEMTGQGAIAQDVTRRALTLASAIQAADITYRWEWQLGRLLTQIGNEPEAIAAYSQAFGTLQSLRRDLVALNPDAQFVFRESAEPIYRQYVELLLRSPNQTNLRTARQVIESLQLAELENFFQQGCLGNTLQIDQVVNQPTSAAAVIYPIILPDRLEVIAKLPGEEDLYHYPAQPIRRANLEAIVNQLQLDLQEAYTFEAVKTGSKQVYDWLIAPVRAELEQRGVKTLVFVLDGALRSIPMASLYDGSSYLMEHYAVSVVLGLEIRDPKSLPTRDRLTVLAGSVTKPPPDLRTVFSDLANVSPEVDEITRSGLKTTPLKEFTRQQFSTALDKSPFQIIHLATHGQFSSDRETTFLLAADDVIKVDELGQIFRDRTINNGNAIELLILSACETASGDDRDVLGIAGTAVRAGARSAIASLWSLDDASGAALMKELYNHLGEPGVSRAEALRLAQQTLAQDPQYRHPRYWAPYILIGSWL